MASKGSNSIPRQSHNVIQHSTNPHSHTKKPNFKLADVDAGAMTKAPFKLTKHDYGNEEVIVEVNAIYAIT